MQSGEPRHGKVWESLQTTEVTMCHNNNCSDSVLRSPATSSAGWHNTCGHKGNANTKRFPLSGVRKLDECSLPRAEPQLHQVHAAAFREGAAVGAEGDRSMPRQRRFAHLQHRLLLRPPVEGSQVAIVLIPDPQVRQRWGGVGEEEEVPVKEGALFGPQLAHRAEEVAEGQPVSLILLETEKHREEMSGFRS